MKVNFNEKDYIENYVDEYMNRRDKSELFYKCKKCEGYGLKNFKVGGHWSGEFCDTCRGKGLLYFFELLKGNYNMNDFYIDDERN